MRLADIEALLGQERVDEIQRSVSAAYSASRGSLEGAVALRGLLVGVLAAVITTDRHRPVARRLASEDAAQLVALVAKIEETRRCPSGSAVSQAVLPLSREGAPQRDPAGPTAAAPIPLALGAGASSALVKPSGQVLPFTRIAQRPSPAEVLCWTAVARNEPPLLTAIECASSIARLRERIAQSRRAVARAKLQITTSRGLCSRQTQPGLGFFAAVSSRSG